LGHCDGNALILLRNLKDFLLARPILLSLNGPANRKTLRLLNRDGFGLIEERAAIQVFAKYDEGVKKTDMRRLKSNQKQ